MHCRLYICRCCAPTDEKPWARKIATCLHKSLRSRAVRECTAGSSAISWHFAPQSQRMALKTHVLMMGKPRFLTRECLTVSGKIGVLIKIVHLHHSLDRIVGQGLDLLSLKDILGSSRPQNWGQMASSMSRRRVESDPGHQGKDGRTRR